MVPSPCGPSLAAGSPGPAEGVLTAAGEEKLPVALRSMPRRLEAKSSATSRAYAAFSACSSGLPFSCMAAAGRVPSLYCCATNAEHVLCDAGLTGSRVVHDLLEMTSFHTSSRGTIRGSVVMWQGSPRTWLLKLSLRDDEEATCASSAMGLFLQRSGCSVTMGAEMLPCTPALLAAPAHTKHVFSRLAYCMSACCARRQMPSPLSTLSQCCLRRCPGCSTVAAPEVLQEWTSVSRPE